MRNRYKISCMVLCAILMIAFVLFSFNILNVQAYSDSSIISERMLYNETNTYNIDNNCFDENNFMLSG